MKSKNDHIFAAGWTQLASNIEKTFFKIERESSWLAAIVNGSIAGGSVALIAWLLTSSASEGDYLLFARLGSSAASIVFAPVAKSNSLRTIICAYIIASLSCLVIIPIRDLIPLPFQCFLAVAVPITLMRVSDTMHPAAIGSAMAFIIYHREPKAIILLLLAIIGLLTITKILAYIYLEDLTFKQFGKEFRREYYGREVTITVVKEDNN
ncbi:MAG: CBS-domain-containing membrane protein [Pirellulaceae bacterium]|jgi:CBS-domain-containing membrane protein